MPIPRFETHLHWFLAGTAATLIAILSPLRLEAVAAVIALAALAEVSARLRAEREKSAAALARTRGLEGLLRAAQIIASTPVSEEVLASVAEIIRRALGAVHCHIQVAARGSSAALRPRGLEDLLEREMVASAGEPNGKAQVLALPILLVGEPLGVLVVEAERPQGFGRDEVETCQAIVDATAIGLDVHRRRDRVAELEETHRYFLSNLSHELQTPIQKILGFTELGQCGAGDPVVNFSSIGSAVGELRGRVDDILELSRVALGDQRRAASLQPLGAVFKAAVMEAQAAASAAGLELVSEMEPQLGAVHVDGPAVLKILRSLLDNAVKFTAAGSIGLHARCLPATGSDLLDHVELRVVDSGLGIDPSDLRIFDDFRQGDASDQREFSGLGLGLAIARRLVEGLGGVIEAARAPAGGAEFRVLVPLAATPVARAA